MPQSHSVDPTTSVILHSTAWQQYSISDLRATFRGSRSGVMAGRVKLAGDGASLIVTPERVLAFDETVAFELTYQNGEERATLDAFHYQTMIARASTPTIQTLLGIPAMFNPLDTTTTDTTNYALPVLQVAYDDSTSAKGSIMMANFGFFKIPNASYALVLDEHAKILRKRWLPAGGTDFKLQPNGLVTYCDFSAFKYYGTDKHLNVVDSFTCVNGSVPDVHELLVLPDGSYMILGALTTREAMSQHVPGRTDTADVLSNTIQRFDKDRQLVFEWRALDHFRIMDATHEPLDTAKFIDFQHANSLELDHDGNILMSNRHMDELTKITSTTGEILWRMGGKNNQFTFTNDTLQFSHQHSARVLANGNLLLFDNGNFHVPARSRAVEFAVDEANHTVSRVWEYRHPDQVLGYAMGSVQRLSNGNTLIGWGASDHSVTEVRPDGTMTFDLRMPAGNFSYRAFKFDDPTLARLPTTERWQATPLAQATVNSEGMLCLQYYSSFNEPVSVRLLDIRGAVIREIELGEARIGEMTYTSSVGQLSTGSYILAIQSAGSGELRSVAQVQVRR